LFFLLELDMGIEDMIQMVEHLNSIQAKISDQNTSDVTETAYVTVGTTIVYADLEILYSFSDEFQVIIRISK